MHKGPGHHLLIPSQYLGGGPLVKVFKRCGLAMGGKWGSILGFPPKFLWGECPAGIGFHQKEESIGWDHLMHAIEVDGNQTLQNPHHSHTAP